MSNTKDIKDYLHLYIGCQVIDSEGDIGTLKGVCQSEVERRKLLAIVDFGGEVFFELYTEEVQIILRPLSDMTEDEAKECWKASKSPSYRFVGFDGPSRTIFYKNGNGNSGSEVLNKPEQFRYLLSRGFDLFGLIEDGLAIDATKQPQP